MGIALAAAGFLLAALTVHVGALVLLVPSAIVLGACYGMLLVAGLTAVEELAAPDDLAAVTAVFYCLTYVGFATPYVVTAVGHHVSPSVVFVVAAVVAVLLIPLSLITIGPE